MLLRRNICGRYTWSTHSSVLLRCLRSPVGRSFLRSLLEWWLFLWPELVVFLLLDSLELLVDEDVVDEEWWKLLLSPLRSLLGVM